MSSYPYIASRARTRLIVFACLLLAVPSFIAQKQEDWRPIDPGQLKEAPFEPGADVEALLWEVRVDDSGSDVIFSNYVRVKIFNDRGRDQYTKFDIPFAKGIKIKDLAARVIKPDGSIMDVAESDIFEREIVRANGIKIKAKSFAVPGIEPGVIVEYRYREIDDYSDENGTRFDLQRDIPVKDLAYYYKPVQGVVTTVRTYNGPNVSFTKATDGYYLLERRDVKAFKQEPFMPPDDVVRPYIRVGPVRNLYYSDYLKRGLAAWIKKQSSDLQKTAADIVKDASTTSDKLAALYAFCQTRIANTAYDTNTATDPRPKQPEIKSLKDILKRSSASPFYINVLFTALAQSLGMDARIAFLSDRRRAFTSVMKNFDQQWLLPSAVGVSVDGSWKLLDPGCKFLPFGDLLWYQQDSAVELVGYPDFAWKQSPVSNYTLSNTKRSAKFELDAEGTVSGTVKIEMTGQPALLYRLENYDEPTDGLKNLVVKDVQRRLNSAVVTDVSVSNLTAPSLPLTIAYKVKIANYAQKTGKRLILQPNMFGMEETGVFESADRTYDVFFKYPWSENDVIEIAWPAGYAVESAEPPLPVVDEDKSSSLTITMTPNQDKRILVYKRDFFFGGGGSTLFPATAYKSLKERFDAFQKADDQSILFVQH